VMDFAARNTVPVGNAILTVENGEQALVRADPARGNKGAEAVDAALALLRLKRRLRAR
jgi:6,7-dimethyl-8-ribityllumazine synthase